MPGAKITIEQLHLDYENWLDSGREAPSKNGLMGLVKAAGDGRLTTMRTKPKDGLREWFVVGLRLYRPVDGYGPVHPIAAYPRG
ncbi:MAG TPA: hypothetical protein P5114_09020 [Hyphomicrobiaceae bacterium]|nr:hypothetical protein [Hyphomicrobiaceae bacterium]